MEAAQQQIEPSASSSAADTVLVQIPKDGVDRIEAAARPLLAKLLLELRGSATVDDLIGQARRGEIQIWLAYGPTADEIFAIQLTTLERLPRKLVCRLIGTAGSRMLQMNVRGFVEEIKKWAIVEGCDAIECEGRPGWRRYLGPEFEEKSRVWIQELEGGGQ